MAKQRILFIGNSYTYYNEMYDMFADLARAAGEEVEVAHVLAGGYTLERFANPDDPQGKLVDEALAGPAWDLVILQEQSRRPTIDRQAFLNGLRALLDKIEPVSHRRMLYATWGYETGNPLLEEMQLTQETMTETQQDSYAYAARLYNLEIAPVGLAFWLGHEEFALYDPDHSHPSRQGSYLAACLLFAQAYGRTPVGLNSFSGLEESAAKRLQEIAQSIWMRRA